MVTQEEADYFAKVVDEHLQKINLEYESKRKSFRLHEPQAHILLSDAYSRFKAACLRDGFRDGQFKFNLLMQDEKRRKRFSLIERMEERMDNIGKTFLDRAERWDSRIDERRERRSTRSEERAKRRAQRKAARQSNRSKSKNKKEIK